MAFLETLTLAGISHVFVNLGSDHSSFLEAIAQSEAGCGRIGDNGHALPKFISVAHEMVALSAAQGYYQATGKMAAVVLHVDAGLLNAGGAIHNVFRGKCPVLVFAGLSALTVEGEYRGSRTEFINWIQDVHDQAGIVRNYSKYTYEIRAGRNIPQVTMRAIQIAKTEPQGPVYLLGAREVMEEEIPFPPARINLRHWQPVAYTALIPDQAAEVAHLLLNSHFPLAITSWLGNDHIAAKELREICEHLSIPVLDSAPLALNLPASHPLYLGSKTAEPGQHPALAEADVILIVDSDIPFIPIANRPNPDATIIHIGSDPLKMAMPLYYDFAEYRFQANSAVALAQIRAALPHTFDADITARLATRAEAVRYYVDQRMQFVRKQLVPTEDGPQHPAIGIAALGRLLPQNSIVYCEATSNFPVVQEHLGLTDSRRYRTSGASSLGYNGGAAVGAKIGIQAGHGVFGTEDTLVVAITGDGSYMFSIPSTVQHLSSRNNAPILTVILSNGGWKSPKLCAMLVHPNGFVANTSALVLGSSFGPKESRPDYAGLAVAAAGGPKKAWGARVMCGSPEMEDVFKEAIKTVQEGRSATVELILPEEECA